MLNKLKEMIFGKKTPELLGRDMELILNDRVKGREYTLYYRQPTGAERLGFVHDLLESEKSELRKLTTEDLTAHDLHSLTREKKFIPWAKKILTGVKGYADAETGKDISIKDISLIEKYYPEHLEALANNAFQIDAVIKKND